MRKFLILITTMVISVVLTACTGDGTVAVPPSFSSIRIDNTDPVSDGNYVTFYRGKQETVLVEIAVNNPSNAPIRSVKINGYTYLSTKFTEESTNSVVYFELNVGNTLGETIYAVDQISYLDGENTIGVPVSGSNSFRMYVYKDLPSVERENYQLNRDGISIDFNITDLDGIIAPNTLIAELYAGETLIDTKELNSGFINVEFTDLLANRLYEVKILANFDRDDNNGLQTNVILYNGTYSTLSNGLPSASIDKLEVTSNLVTFDISFIDTDEVVVDGGLSVEIFDGETLIESISITGTVSGLSFDELLNDKEYVIKVMADYDLLDGLGTREDNVLAVHSFSTLPRQVPTPLLQNLNLFENSIDFDIVIDDPEGIIDASTLIANLYLEGEFVNTAEVTEYHADFQVNNLFANNEFTIELVANYDLNDGQGVQVDQIIFSETYSTAANAVPTVFVEELEVAQGYVTLLIDVKDNNNTLMGAIEVLLYEDDTVVDSLFIDETTTDIVFDYATKAGIPYYIDFVADYNLQDGTGALFEQSLRRVVAYTAEAKAPIAEIKNVVTTSSSIDFDVEVIDADNTVVPNETMVYIYLGTTLIDSAVINVGTTSVSFTGLLSNNEYTIKVLSDYNLDDGSGVLQDQELLRTAIMTDTKTVPTSVISNVQKDDTSITLDVEIVDPDLVVDDTQISIVLLHEGVEAATQSINNGENFGVTFPGLLSDNNYTVEIYLDYNLNDGAGDIEDVLVGEQIIITDPKYAPTATFVFTDADETTITADIRIEDTYGVLVPGGDLKAVLMLNDTPTGEEYDLTVGLNSNIEFTDVYANERYYIDIVADYDLNDGGAIFEDEVLASDYIITDVFDDISAAISEVSATTSSITFDVFVSDPSDVITLDGSGDLNLWAAIYFDIEAAAIQTIPLDEGDNTAVTFTGIDSDTEYTIQIEADYDNNEIDAPVLGAVLDFIEQSTLPLSAPTSTITNVISDYNSFTMDIFVRDDDDTIETGTLQAVLYEEDGTTVVVGKEVSLNVGNNETVLFDGLNSNNTYIVKVIADYDLNDEAGIVPNYVLRATDVTTLEKTVPDTIILAQEITYDTITILIELDDLYNVMIPDTYQAHLVVDNVIEASKDITSTEISFDLSGFLADYPFEIRITGNYDLDDGEPIIIGGTITSLDYTTLAYDVPTAVIDSLEINQNTIDAVITIDDSSNTVIDNLKAVLYDQNDLIIETIPLVDGENTIAFTHTVNHGELYSVMVFADYNLRDGNGTVLAEPLAEMVITSYNKLIPQATISNVTTTKDSITFDVQLDDNDSVITVNGSEVELYLGDTLINSDTLSVGPNGGISFGGLLSDTEYTVRVITNFDNGDGNNEYTDYEILVETATTVAKEVPTASILEDTITDDTIVVDITIVDDDNVTSSRTAILYDYLMNEVASQSLSVGLNDNVTFSGLYSSENYTIEVYVDYNLNDGTASVEDARLTYQDNRTSSLNEPTGVVTDLSATTDTISFLVEIVDIDSTITNNLKAVLSKDGVELQSQTLTVGSNSVDFTGLDADTEYLIEIVTDYTLKERTGEVFGDVLDFNYYYTRPYTTPTMAVTEYVGYKESIDAEILITDDDGVGSNYVARLYKDGVATGEEYTLSIGYNDVTFSTSILSNYNYEIRLFGDYDLLDTVNVETNFLFETKEVKTAEKELPGFLISNFNQTYDAVEFEYTLDDVDNVLVDGILTAHLYVNDTEITSTELSTNFVYFDISGFVADFEFEIRITADYDMSDGTAVETDGLIRTLTYTTLAYDVPTAVFNDVYASQSGIEADITITDGDSRITNNLEAHLYDNSNVLIETIALSVGSNNITFSQSPNPQDFYHIVVEADYDMLDGNGVQTDEVLHESLFVIYNSITPEAEISSVTSDDTSITFNVDMTDIDTTITGNRYAQLYLDGVYQEQTSLGTGANPGKSFGSLLSGVEYEIRIVVDYDNGDGNGVYAGSVLDTYTISTTAKEEPTASITVREINPFELVLDVLVTDPDLLTTARVVNLYDVNGGLVDTEILTVSNNQNISFTGLESDTGYVIKVELTYDLNDGDGSLLRVSDSVDTNTAEAVAPSLGIVGSSVTTTSITSEIVVADEDSVGSDFRAVLYKDGIATGEEYALSVGTQYVTFNTGLLSDNEYEIRLFADYDLNDGATSENDFQFDSQLVTTAAKQLPAITVSSEIITHDGIRFNLHVEDVDSVLEDGILTAGLYVSNVLVTEKVVQTDTAYFDLTGFVANFDYEIRITADYNLDDGDGLVSGGTITSLDYTTLAYEAPTAIINDVEATQSGIEATITVTDDDSTSTANLEAHLYDEAGALLQTIALATGANSITFSQIADPQVFYHIVVESDYDVLDSNGEQTDQVLAESLVQIYNNLLPEAAISNVVITETSITFDVDISDVDGVITGNRKALLYLDGAYVTELTLATNSEVGEVFSSLFSGREYEIRIVADYNNGDGNGVYNAYQMTTATNTTDAYATPTAEITVDTIDPSQLIFDVIVDDDDTRTTVRELKLYDEDDNLLSTESLSIGGNFNIAFTGLSGLTAYRVEVVLTADLNDGDGSVARVAAELEVNTTASNAPSGTINGTTATTKTIVVDYDLIDDDATTTERWLRIYDDGDTMLQEQAITAGVDQTYTFDNLPPAASYTVRIEVTYDLNDNNGVQSDIALDSAQNTTGTFISFDYDDTNIGKKEAAIDVLVDDYESIITGSTLTATLFQGATEIGTYIVTTETATTVSMANLLSDFEYTLKVSATYNVGDGNGDVTEVISTETFTTDPLLRPDVTIDPFSAWTIGATVQIEIDFGSDDDNVTNNTGWMAYLYVDGVLADSVDIDASYAGNPEGNINVPINFTGWTVGTNGPNESYTVVVTAMADFNEVAGEGEVETAMDSVAGVDAGN